MLTIRGAYAGFAAPDIDAERAFYANRLGITVHEGMGNLMLDLPGGGRVLIYPKPDHQPATFTVLNLEVADIDAAVDELGAAGIEMERYEGFEQDERGVIRDEGHAIAWCKDPAGNILSVVWDA